MFASLSKLPCLVLGLALVLAASQLQAQENDPTAKSDVINKTLAKIRDVEQLDSFVEQNKALQAENKKLKADIASIQKQLAKLTQDLAQQTATLRKQLLQMPTFEVQSKVIAGDRSMAMLKTQTGNIRVRANTEMSVAVSDGVWVLMQVEKITKDMIVLSFPELDRTVYLYD